MSRIKKKKKKKAHMCHYTNHIQVSQDFESSIGQFVDPCTHVETIEGIEGFHALTFAVVPENARCCLNTRSQVEYTNIVRATWCNEINMCDRFSCIFE